MLFSAIAPTPLVVRQSYAYFVDPGLYIRPSSTIGHLVPLKGLPQP